MILELLLVLSLAHTSTSQYTEDCGATYGCFLHPADCKNTQCQFVIKWRDQSFYVEFIVATSISETSDYDVYSAIAFSGDHFMGDDSVNICRLKSYSVETYYTDWIRNTDVALSTNRNVGVSNFKIGLNQSFVTCSFWRLKHIPVHTGLNSRIGTVFNLTQPYYLLVAYGKTNSLLSPLYHGDAAFSSSTPIDFCLNSVVSARKDVSNRHKQKAHACLMVIAWILFASTGLVVSRYYRYLYKDKRFWGLEFWYLIHRTLMSGVLVLSVLAMLIALADTRWKWVSNKKKSQFGHSVFGILTLIFVFFQILIGFLRPRGADPRRQIFNKIHQYSGLIIYLFAMITIFIGVCVNEMHMGRFGWSLMFIWIIWCLVLPLSIEIVNQLIAIQGQSNIYHVSGNESGKEANTATVSTTMPNRTRKRYIIAKNVLLVAHICVSFGFTFTFIFFISITGENSFS